MRSEFQERLNELLLENNLNRLQFANKIGVASTTINDYFNYGYYPSINFAKKMANYFNVSLDYLFGLTDEIHNNDKNNNTFIENFTTLLKENHLSIAKAMKELKMSEYNYYRWKAGLFPKTASLIEIAKYFNVSIDYLVGRSYEK